MDSVVEVRWTRLIYGMWFVHRESICGQNYVDPGALLGVVSLYHIKFISNSDSLQN